MAGEDMEIKEYPERRSESRRNRWLSDQRIWARSIEMQTGKPTSS